MTTFAKNVIKYLAFFGGCILFGFGLGYLIDLISQRMQLEGWFCGYRACSIQYIGPSLPKRIAAQEVWA